MSPKLSFSFRLCDKGFERISRSLKYTCVCLIPYKCRNVPSLRAGRSGDRIPVAARFSSPVQTDPRAHPASYTMSTGSFLGVKRPGRGVDHPLSSSAEVKERVQLYLYSPSASSWPVTAYIYKHPTAFRS
jgi:hypothetical protein